jgi:DNA-binding IclR family transcriptional regulator
VAALPPAEDRYHVPALARGLQLLSQFSREQPELSGAELARQLELPRASVFRMLCTLEQAGFLERCVDGVHYKLGLGVLRLGFELLASMELTELGRPVIEELRERSGYSAHLVVRDGREVVFIAKVAGRSSLFQSVQVGARLPAHATVLGRVLLSDLSAGELAALYRHASLAAYTAKTPTTLSALSELIAQDRQRGHGISMGGYESGISTVAAPVFSGPGKVAAAISVTVPAQRIEEPELAELVAMVCDAARQLSDRLQHLPGRGPWSAKTSQRKAA